MVNCQNIWKNYLWIWKVKFKNPTWLAMCFNIMLSGVCLILVFPCLILSLDYVNNTNISKVYAIRYTQKCVCHFFFSIYLYFLTWVYVFVIEAWGHILIFVWLVLSYHSCFSRFPNYHICFSKWNLVLCPFCMGQMIKKFQCYLNNQWQMEFFKSSSQVNIHNTNCDYETCR